MVKLQNNASFPKDCNMYLEMCKLSIPANVRYNAVEALQNDRKRKRESGKLKSRQHQRQEIISLLQNGYEYQKECKNK